MQNDKLLSDIVLTGFYVIEGAADEIISAALLILSNDGKYVFYNAY